MSTTPATPSPPEHRAHWLPRAHPLSWWTLVITTCAILMTAIDGGILPAVLTFGYSTHYVVLALIALACLIPLAKIKETVDLRHAHEVFEGD